MSLLAFGEALIDFLSEGGEPEKFIKFPGGAPANVAVAFSKLGGQSHFCGMLGKDMFGDYLLKSLTAEQVDTRYCKQTSKAKTGLAFVSLDDVGERSFSFYRPPAADLLFTEQDFKVEAFRQTSIFHICSNSLTEDAIYNTTLAGLKLAEIENCLRSFDINLRLNLWQDTEFTNIRIWKCIEHSDVIKLSKEEMDYLIAQDPTHSYLQEPKIQALISQNKHRFSQEEIKFLTSFTDQDINTRTLSFEQIAFSFKCLSLGVKLVVISNGPNPIAYYGTTVSGQVNIPHVVVADTTAAGDAFVGALLFRLSVELEANDNLINLTSNAQFIRELVCFATEYGALTCTKLGAFPSLPTMEEYNSFYKE